ncbi:hypothetical protein B5181_37020 [Streptomyces sp. 4F]|nr:hypothetical protein B5181_37020 [Streptomyces sp. 4F]
MPHVDTAPGTRPDVCVNSKEHLSMSRIAKGLALTCGNTVDIIGALNPAFGNECVND